MAGLRPICGDVDVNDGKMRKGLNLKKWIDIQQSAGTMNIVVSQMTRVTARKQLKKVVDILKTSKYNYLSRLMDGTERMVP